MQQQQQINAYAPYIDKEAIKELYGREPEYYRKDDLQLKYTEDDGPWQPSDEIRDFVPNIDQIEVELIDETTDLNLLTEKFLDEEKIGLVLMGRNISRHTRPAMIVLTTRDRYYAIDPDDTERGIQFLKVCVENKNLMMYTTSGLREADCLYHNYKIVLHNSSALCCLGLHVHLMKVMSMMPEEYGISSKPFYPPDAFNLARRSKEIRLESFETLVQIWLGLDTRDITFNGDQYIHLNRKPLDQTAVNIIKKRCSLVLCLAEALEIFSGLELHVMNRNVLKSLTDSCDAVSTKIRKLMRNNEKINKASVQYYQHLDGGVGS